VSTHVSSSETASELGDAERALPPAVGQALELIRTSRRRLSLAQLALRVGLSKFHLAREFSRYLGEPPVRFQNMRRLRRAARLLRSGCKPADVAYRLNYADQAYFSRLFKGHFGMTPGAYARAHRSVLVGASSYKTQLEQHP